jgi:predicted metalloendopeptidase
MARRQCLVEQYSAYREPETSRALDGERLASENIADLTGIGLARGAYEQWTSSHNGTRHRLIGVDFPPNQLFWIVMAQRWCSVSREGEQLIQIIVIVVVMSFFRSFQRRPRGE